jgi:hypothetical protein
MHFVKESHGVLQRASAHHVGGGKREETQEAKEKHSFLHSSIAPFTTCAVVIMTDESPR